MIAARTRPALGRVLYFLLMFTAATYFTFAAVQGDFGVFRQVAIAAEATRLTAERNVLVAELAELTNRTLRLSDAYLDLDLLDEQARAVLGYIRADEVVIR